MRRKYFKAFFGLALLVLIGAGFYSLSFKALKNSQPLPPFYRKGAFHVHSNFSDGRGSIAEICRDAARARLDFVMLNDHGRPNLLAAAASGWQQGILLVGASEFSLNEGHLAAAGFKIPTYIFPPEASEAIAEINENQGFSFVSHPFDDRIPWTDRRVRGFSGVELISLYQIARKASVLRMAAFFWQYLWNPDYALTALIAYPQKEMQWWDMLNAQGNYSAIYALDAHAKLAITRKTHLSFPSYAAMFKILTVYVRLAEEPGNDPARSLNALIGAIRRGSFFNAIEALAPANGFEFFYQDAGGRRVEMGGEAQQAGGTLVCKLPFAFSTDILIKKDGKIFKDIRANRLQELTWPIAHGGLYRAEVSLSSGRFNDLPWIVANPIAVARPRLGEKTAEISTGRILVDGENYFQIEKNGRSGAARQWDARSGQAPVTCFSFSLQPEAYPEINFWTALARREKLDFSKYDGFVFETRGSRRMRFWLQFRTTSGDGESAYQHSFLVREQWQKIVIPFSRFRHLFGRPFLPDTARISAFFLLIDNSNAFAGTQGDIFIRQFGLY